MRCLEKGVVPPVLADNHDRWLADFLADTRVERLRTRYRDPVIKEALRKETGWKCVYCESKIGHNTPGDVEHKVPTSKEPKQHFAWGNLTVACSECNRRKLDYYEKGTEFLDPYCDPVEEWLLHLGPMVYWVPGNSRAEVTVRTLMLDSANRVQLFQRKVDVLEKARAIAELISSHAADALVALRMDELARMQDRTAEYSAMVCAYVAALRCRQ